MIETDVYETVFVRSLFKYYIWSGKCAPSRTSFPKKKTLSKQFLINLFLLSSLTVQNNRGDPTGLAEMLKKLGVSELDVCGEPWTELMMPSIPCVFITVISIELSE